MKLLLLVVVLAAGCGSVSSTSDDVDAGELGGAGGAGGELGAAGAGGELGAGGSSSGVAGAPAAGGRAGGGAGAAAPPLPVCDLSFAGTGNAKNIFTVSVCSVSTGAAPYEYFFDAPDGHQWSCAMCSNMTGATAQAGCTVPKMTGLTDFPVYCSSSCTTECRRVNHAP